MQYGEGRMGRIFALRLEDGERLPEVLETFAREQGLAAGLVIFLGGLKDGSRMIVGPEQDRGEAIIPIFFSLSGIQEVLAVGTFFPNEAGESVLHMHAAAGREGEAHVGCTRAGVETWLVGEVIILEIVGTGGTRRAEPPSGFHLLQF